MLRNFFRRAREIVTQQYPENRKTLKMYDRFKGEIIMPHDANNRHRCTGCGICFFVCPEPGGIKVLRRELVPAAEMAGAV